MNNPIFIFSAGPRSGSTLIQRLVLSSREVLVWGETAGALNLLLDSIRIYELNARPAIQGGSDGNLQFNAFVNSQKSAKVWIANMQPPFKQVLDCYINMINEMYDAPAKALGYPRWGIKEVRGDFLTYRILKSLYPDARFILLVRNPLNAIRSIKQRKFNFTDSFGRKPKNDQLVHFAKNWSRLAADFYKINDIKDGLLIQYEDLVNNNFSLDNLINYLGLKTIDSELLLEKSIDWIAGDGSIFLTDKELDLILPILKPTMDLYGY